MILRHPLHLNEIDLIVDHSLDISDERLENTLHVLTEMFLLRRNLELKTSRTFSSPKCCSLYGLWDHLVDPPLES